MTIDRIAALAVLMLWSTAAQAQAQVAAPAPGPGESFCAISDRRYTAESRIAACNLELKRASNGERASLLLNRQALYRETKAYPAALQDLNELLAGAPDDKVGMYRAERAKVYEAQGNLAAAQADLDVAVAHFPVDAVLRFERATVNADLQRFDAALADLDAVLAAPNLSANGAVRVHGLRGAIHAARNDAKGAIAEFDIGLTLDPAADELRYRRAQVNDAAGLYREASADYELLKQHLPQEAQIFNSACWMRAAHLKAELDVARTDCDTAVRLQPREANYLDSAGLVALQQKRWGDAWARYDAALAIDKTMASAWFGRGVAALRLGRAAEGQADIAHATALRAETRADFAGYGQTP